MEHNNPNTKESSVKSKRTLIKEPESRIRTSSSERYTRLVNYLRRSLELESLSFASARSKNEIVPGKTHSANTSVSSYNTDKSFQTFISDGYHNSSQSSEKDENRQPVSTDQNPTISHRKSSVMFFERGRLQAMMADIDASPSPFQFGCMDDVDEVESRDQWTGPLDFCVFSIAGLFGLGDIVFFPLNVAKYSLGPYFLAYMLLCVTLGYPVIFMEVALGQFCSRGPVNGWEFAKLFTGIGYASIFVAWFTSVFVTELAFSSIVLGTDFFNSHRWKYLSNGSHLEKMCQHEHDEHENDESFRLEVNLTTVSCYIVTSVLIVVLMLPRIRTRGRIVSGLFIVEALLFLSICIFGVTLPGAVDGFGAALQSNWSSFADSNMWLSACGQMIYSMHLIAGYHMTLSSYNHFHYQIPFNVLIISITDVLVSSLGILMTYSYMGFLAHFTGLGVGVLMECTGDELWTKLLPAAISETGASYNGVLIYFVFICIIRHLNLTTHFEIHVTAVMDYLRLSRRHRKYAVLGLSAVPCVCMLFRFSKYSHDFYLILKYCISTTLSYTILLFFIVAIAWVFGVEKFIQQTECALGWATTPILASKEAKTFWKICWKFVSPSVCIIKLIISISSRVVGEYADILHSTVVTICTIIQASTYGIVVGTMVYLIYTAKSNLKIRRKSENQKKTKIVSLVSVLWSRIRFLTTPTAQWRPLLPQHRAIVEVGAQADRIELRDAMRKSQSKVVTSFEELGLDF